jgi:16S rRNA (cytosine1402-N4)-methyltransferase
MDSPPEQAPKHKRRVRYKGKNPRKFHEKYKELNPEQYAQEIEKIKNRGATAAGTHRPICVDEILEVLDPKPGEIALDATLGYGGHTSQILPRLLPGGRLIGLDQDPIELPKTTARLRGLGFTEDSLLIGPVNFSRAREFLTKSGISKVDLVLADLGVSSMQIDTPERGFTFKQDGPLDLRMNPQAGISAADLLAGITEQELAEVLEKNSDEIRSAAIAKALVQDKPKTTLQLAETMRRVIKGFSKKVQAEEGDKPIRRTFQALRIAVNDEFGVLDKFLADLPKILNKGGRVAILSFHSGEDRRVKKSFQAFERAGTYSQVSPEFIRPSMEEQRANSRSKSAKLRWAIV